MGQLYFISRAAITKQTEDRDFLYRIITGKSLLEGQDTSDIIYAPMETVGGDYYNGGTTITEVDVVSAPGDYKTLIAAAHSAISRVELPKINKSKESLQKAVENSEKAPPHITNVLRQLEEGVRSANHFSMYEYIHILIDYVNLENEYTRSEISDIVAYVLVAFVRKNNNDFPSGLLTETQMTDLINKTAKMEDGHPFKWTARRKKTACAQTNTYRKMVYCDDYLYLWKTYVQNDTAINDLTEHDIRTKYLVDSLLQKLCYDYGTKQIVFSNFNDEQLQRVRHIFNHISLTVRKYKREYSMVNTHDLLLPEQIENQYVLLTDKHKHEIEGAAKHEGQRRADSVQVHEYLKTNELLQETSIF